MTCRPRGGNDERDCVALALNQDTFADQRVILELLAIIKRHFHVAQKHLLTSRLLDLEFLVVNRN